MHYDRLILATGSRSFFPPMEGMWADDKTLTPGVFGFRSLDDCSAMIDYAATKTKAVVIGGGLLGLEAARGLQNRGLRSTSCTPPATLMNAQLDDAGGAILRRSVREHRHRRPDEKRTKSVLNLDGSVSGLTFADGSEIACDMIVVSAGIRPNVGLAQRAGLTVERAIVVDDHMRSIDDDNVYVVGECAQHRGQVYGLVAPLWEQAAVLADHLTEANKRSVYQGSRTATKLKVAGVDVASMGQKGPEHPDDEFVQFSEPKHGIYKTIVVRDGKLVGATLIGDVRKVAFLMQAFDRGLPASGGTHFADVRHRHPGRRGGRRRVGGGRAGVQLQRRQQVGVGRVRERRREVGRRRDGRDARRQGLRVVQVVGDADRRVGRRRRRRGGRIGELVRAGDSLRQAGVDAAHPRAPIALGVIGFRRARTGRQARRELQDGARVAAADDVGRRVRRRDAMPDSSTTACTPTFSATAPSPSSRR